jgi:hypothetical protein
MIFAREISDPLTSLVKKVDEANAGRAKAGKKMGSFVVFLSDEEGMEKKLKGFAEKEKLQHVALQLDNRTGPAFEHDDGTKEPIAKEADITVILYVNKTVKVNRAYKKGEFKAEEVDKILKDLPPLFKEYDE